MSNTTTAVLFSGAVNLIVPSASSNSIANPGLFPTLPGGAFNFRDYRELAVYGQLLTLTGGASPTVQLLIATMDDIGNFFNLNPTAPNWAAANANYYHAIGAGLGYNNALGSRGAVIWNITGAPTAVSFQLLVVAKG